MRFVQQNDNPTCIFVTFDDREPTEDDHDFGADFNFIEGQDEIVGKAVTDFVKDLNTIYEGLDPRREATRG